MNENRNPPPSQDNQMTNQTEALRLADNLETAWCLTLAANELRRLHEIEKRYEWLCNRLNQSKSSASQQMLDALGLFDASVLQALDEIIAKEVEGPAARSN